MRRRTILAAITNLAWPWQWVLSAFSNSSAIAKASPAPSGVPHNRMSGARGFTLDSSVQPIPKFEDYATVEARVNGEPVYCLDYMMYVYGISPDLMPGIVMQEGNTNPGVKIKPKKSWEIKHNLLGSNTEQVPRTRYNDSHPLLPIHLIDGDRDTAWASFGSIEPDVYPEWIRIDLPIEATVTSVALVCSKNFYPKSSLGRALPKQLTIKLSTDAWHWETVHESQHADVNTTDALEIKFAPRRAKQIWIIGNHFAKSLATPSGGGGPTCFSLGGVEVCDPAGNNLALLSRGAGVTTSSTCYGHNCDRVTQEALWAPLQYDMGMKWVRISSGASGAYDWEYIEKERGKYEFDPVLDRWLRDVQRCGINLIWGLGLYGNPIYHNPPWNTNWSEVRLHAFTDGMLGESSSLNVDDNPEMFAAWLRYIDFVVRRLKGRVYIYEIGNEWNGGEWNDQQVEWYMNIFEKAYETVKKADPEARIMPGNPYPFLPDLLLAMLGQERKAGLHDGKLMASGGDWNDLNRSTFVVNENLKLRDAEIELDALNRGSFGVVLRYQSPRSFVVAGSRTYSLFITERTGDTWKTTEISSKRLGRALTSNLHFKVQAEGPQVTLTVSDGERVVTVSHRIKNQQLNAGGSVGLVQLTGANQEFTNLRVSDLAGKPFLREGFRGEEGGLPVGWEYVFGPNLGNPIKPGLASKLDGLGWHPNNPNDAPYFKAVREMQKQCGELGFRGRYYATEIPFDFSYPDFEALYGMKGLSELQMALATMISVVGHSGLDTVANTQIIHFTGYACSDSNCRWAFPGQVITPVQPSVMYYMWRTLATVLDDFRPAEFPVGISGSKEFLRFTFARGEKERMVAVWIANPEANSPSDISETQSEIKLPGIRVEQAWVIDLMNGMEQELRLTRTRQDTFIRDVRIKNYPTMIRFFQ